MLGLKRTILVGFALCSMAAFALGGCSDSEAPGTLRVSMVDAPLIESGVEAVMVTFSSIRVHRDDDAEASSDGWTEIMGAGTAVEDRTFNLLELVNGVSALLGEQQLEAGTYTQIRIIVENAIARVDGVDEELTIPSGPQTGIKLVGNFTIESEEITDLLLDFDVEQSVRNLGNGDWEMRPTIRVVPVVLSGSISGVVLPIGSNAVVNVYAAGSADLVTTTQVDALTGEFMVKGLLAGTYDIQIVAEGFSLATVSGVAVTAGAETEASGVTLVAIGS